MLQSGDYIHDETEEGGGGRKEGRGLRSVPSQVLGISATCKGWTPQVSACVLMEYESNGLCVAWDCNVDPTLMEECVGLLPQ